MLLSLLLHDSLLYLTILQPSEPAFAVLSLSLSLHVSLLYLTLLLPHEPAFAALSLSARFSSISSGSAV